MTAFLLTLLVQDKGIQWMSNYEEALKAAKSAKKNLIAHFSTEW